MFDKDTYVRDIDYPPLSKEGVKLSITMDKAELLEWYTAPELVKLGYPKVQVGDRIALVFLPDEPAFGTVFRAGDQGIILDIAPGIAGHRQIVVEWENGHSLLLLEGTDAFAITQQRARPGARPC